MSRRLRKSGTASDRPAGPWGSCDGSHSARCTIDSCTILTEEYEAEGEVSAQALLCPYYVPLSGRLGADWGVIVNPEFARYGLLSFEHDDCGCPGDEDRHDDDPDQDGDMWWKDWRPSGGAPATA